METQNNAVNGTLTVLATMDGAALARVLMLALVRNDALLERLARDVLIRWAELSFDVSALSAMINALYSDTVRPLVILPSMMHPERLVLCAGVLDVGMWIRRSNLDGMFLDSGALDFFAALVLLFRRHTRYIAGVSTTGHAWEFTAAFSGDVVRKCMHVLASELRGRIQRLIAFDVDRWDLLWFSIHEPVFLYKNELAEEHVRMLRPVARAGLAAPIKKKKKISQDKQLLPK